MKCPPFSNTSHPAMISSSGRNHHKSFRGLAQRPHLPASWTKPLAFTCLFSSGYHDICNDLFMSLGAVRGHGPCLRLYYNHFAAADTLKVCLFTEFTSICDRDMQKIATIGLRCVLHYEEWCLTSGVPVWEPKIKKTFIPYNNHIHLWNSGKKNNIHIS